MRITTILFALFAILLLVYLMMPGPTSVYIFPQLPSSYKSNLDGDTWQQYNLVAFFSGNFRKDVISFYDRSYRAMTWLPFGPLHLNYPPEFAFVAVKDQTQSTFLEEQVYPMRDSLFINGMEPFLEDGKTPRFDGAYPFIIDGGTYLNKTTIRYYPSFRRTRFVVWLGVVGSVFLLWKMTKKVYYEA
jgi:hypothetical protein